MKYAIFTLIIIGLVLLLYNCNRKVTHTIDNLPPNRIVFGQGGGFTGAYVDFIILENGQVFQQNSLTKTTKELTPIKRRQAKSLFKQVADATITPIKAPGNMTYAIHYQTADSTQSVVWGDASYIVSDSLQQLYETLKVTVKPTVQQRSTPTQ